MKQKNPQVSSCLGQQGCEARGARAHTLARCCAAAPARLEGKGVFLGRCLSSQGPTTGQRSTLCALNRCPSRCQASSAVRVPAKTSPFDADALCEELEASHTHEEQWACTRHRKQRAQARITSRPHSTAPGLQTGLAARLFSTVSVYVRRPRHAAPVGLTPSMLVVDLNYLHLLPGRSWLCNLSQEMQPPHLHSRGTGSCRQCALVSSAPVLAQPSRTSSG